MTASTTGAHDAESSYRRMHRTTVISTLVSVVPVGFVVLVLQAQSWWEAVVYGAALLVAAVVMSQWGRVGFPRFGITGLAICTVAWTLGATVFATSMAFLPLAMVGALIVPRLPRWRAAGVVAFGGGVGAIGATTILVDPTRSLVEFAAVPGAVAIFVAATTFFSDRYWVIFDELEQARKAEADLGIMRERVRFASELHDIQGHTLHVVKLKVALAQKLVHRAPDRASDELEQVHALVGDTITQTKELAYAQRRLNLNSELENAKNLFEAADISVQVAREGYDGGDKSNHGELLGQVLRETTTNILRHARATEVTIRLSATQITIVNDGADLATGGVAAASQPLRGLEHLRQRIVDHGGQLDVHLAGDQFVTAARFAPDPREELQ